MDRTARGAASENNIGHNLIGAQTVNTTVSISSLVESIIEFDLT